MTPANRAPCGYSRCYLNESLVGTEWASDDAVGGHDVPALGVNFLRARRVLSGLVVEAVGLDDLQVVELGEQQRRTGRS